MRIKEEKEASQANLDGQILSLCPRPLLSVFFFKLNCAEKNQRILSHFEGVYPLSLLVERVHEMHCGGSGSMLQTKARLLMKHDEPCWSPSHTTPARFLHRPLN